MVRRIILLASALLFLVSCRTSKSDITLDEAYTQLIYDSYRQDEDSLAYYRKLVNSLIIERNKVDSVQTIVHDSIYVEREGLNTTTYHERNVTIYRSSMETLTKMTELYDSIAYFRNREQLLKDSIAALNEQFHSNDTMVTISTPWWKYIIPFLSVALSFFIVGYIVRWLQTRRPTLSQ